MDADLGHIDTCLGCYLLDYHNRDGELLLGVPVDGRTRNWQVREALRDEFNSCDLDKVPEELDFDKALAECFAKVDGRCTFDSNLEVNQNDNDDWDEPCQAWFLLTWDVPETED